MSEWILLHCKKCLQRSVLDFTAIYFTVFREGDRRSPSCVHSILMGVVAIIPLNDRASNDDSNGGHIVFSSNLDLCLKFQQRQ